MDNKIDCQIILDTLEYNSPPSREDVKLSSEKINELVPRMTSGELNDMLICFSLILNGDSKFKSYIKIEGNELIQKYIK